MQSDAISRSAVHVVINSRVFDTEYPSEFDELTRMIDEIPALDVEPVVRCKDCKHWKSCVGATEHVKCCEWAGYMIGENGYCVYGEVKDNDI